MGYSIVNMSFPQFARQATVKALDPLELIRLLIGEIAA